jgi:hypothetical protein
MHGMGPKHELRPEPQGGTALRVELGFVDFLGRGID